MSDLKPKKKHEGKIFEKDFIESFPKEWYTKRFHDSASSWQGGENARFTPSNICDFMVYNGNLWFLELKSHMGSSIPFSCIRGKQLNGLVDAMGKGVAAGFIFNFRQYNKTYWINAWKVMTFMTQESRKSIPMSWVELNGVLIPQSIKPRGTHQVYDVREIFNRKELRHEED